MLKVTGSLQEDGGLEVSVRDYGVGIPPEHAANLTRPFFQVDASFSRKHQGTGLGLAIVSKLVALHDGSLLIESVPDEGTTAVLRFPASRLISHDVNHFRGSLQNKTFA